MMTNIHVLWESENDLFHSTWLFLGFFALSHISRRKRREKFSNEHRATNNTEAFIKWVFFFFLLLFELFKIPHDVEMWNLSGFKKKFSKNKQRLKLISENPVKNVSNWTSFLIFFFFFCFIFECFIINALCSTDPLPRAILFTKKKNEFFFFSRSNFELLVNLLEPNFS